MNHQNSRRVALILPGFMLLCLLFWAALGISLAYAGVGTPGALEETGLGSEVEPMPGHSVVVYWVLEYEASEGGEVAARVGPPEATVRIQKFPIAVESGVKRSVSGTMVVPAGDKFAVERIGASFSSSRLRYSAQEFDVAGVEGKEGKEGIEGKEGKEGPKGETGAAGSGGGGGGGEGETKVASFGTSAEATLSEFKEGVETVGWCAIGTMLALSLGFVVTKLLRAER